jgi:signal transduction histidine kinase
MFFVKAIPKFKVVACGCSGKLFALLTILVLTLNPSAVLANNSNLKPMTMQLSWKHQFQFAGYYAALAKGYYKDVGLDVSILEGGPSINCLSEITAGKIQFCNSSGGIVKLRTEGHPIVVLAAILQHSPVTLAVKRESGLNTPHDLIGKRVEISNAGEIQPEFHAMFVSEGIDLKDIDIRVNTVGIESLSKDKVDAIYTFETSETYKLEQANYDFKLIHPRNYGIDFYGDVLYTSEDVIETSPEDVKNFRAASIKGWEYAMKNQAEIVDLILTNYNQGKSRPLLLSEAKITESLMLPDLVQVGHMNPGRWRHTADTLVSLGLVKPDYSLKGFIYDPDFKTDLTWMIKWLLGGLLLAVAGFFVMGVFNARLSREIETRIQAEAEIRKQSEQLDRLNAQKDRFFSIIAHDLKGPFNSLMGYCQLLSSEAESFDRETIVESAKTINLSAEKVFKLLDNLLKWASLQTGNFEYEPEQINVGDLVNSNIALFSDSAKDKDIQLKDIVDQTLIVVADINLLGITLRNLIHNGIKFTPQGGQLEINVHPKGDQVEIEISDNGVGMTDKQLSGLFELGENTSTPGTSGETGTGLGLHLCKEFTELQGGILQVESDLGKGSKFRITLPLAPI